MGDEAADAGNRAVRVFLSTLTNALHKAGVIQTGTFSKHTKKKTPTPTWAAILQAFNNCCVYCGDRLHASGTNDGLEKPTVEHLISANQFFGGLYIPANTAPCCRSCQNGKDTKTHHRTWHQQLISVREKKRLPSPCPSTILAIETHITSFMGGYPVALRTGPVADELKRTLRCLHDHVGKAATNADEIRRVLTLASLPP